MTLENILEESLSLETSPVDPAASNHGNNRFPNQMGGMVLPPQPDRRQQQTAAPSGNSFAANTTTTTTTSTQAQREQKQQSSTNVGTMGLGSFADTFGATPQERQNRLQMRKQAMLEQARK